MTTYDPMKGPETVGQALRPLLNLSDEEIVYLCDVTNDKSSFSPEASEIQRLSERLSLGREQTEYLLLSLSILYQHVESTSSVGISHPEAIDNTIEELAESEAWSADQKALMSTRLSQVLSPSKVHKDYLKISRLKAGFQQHAVAFSSIVDLRPKYNDDDPENLKIEGFIPSIQLRITTDSETDKYITVQLSRGALQEMKKTLDRISRKLDAIQNTESLYLKIIEV